MISESDKDLDFILSIFEIRLMVYLGFSPILNKCTSCFSIDNIEYFSIHNNGFECTNCSKVDKSAIKINLDTFNALKYIVSSSPKKLFSFNVSEESKKELKLIASLYMNDKLDKNYQLIKF